MKLWKTPFTACGKAKDIPRNKARQKAILYDNKHKPDKSVITAVAGATNSRISLDTFEKGADHMFMDSCTSSFLRSIAEEGILEGIAKGKIEGRAQEIIELGYEVHLSEDDILERLQRKLNVSIQTAQESRITHDIVGQFLCIFSPLLKPSPD